MSDNLWEPQVADLPTGMLPALLEALPTVLLYAGNLDGSQCNVLGVSYVVEQLQWSGAEAFRAQARCAWTTGRDAPRPAGLVQTGGNLTWAVLVDAGHLVPLTQPETALELARRFVRGPGGWEGVCARN